MSTETLILTFGEGAKPREPRDRYVEPPEAVEALLRVEKFDGPIWDPAAGTRSLAGVLIRHGYKVLATDANDPRDARLDFLKLGALEHRGRFNIVSNPPYRRPILDRFMLRALALATGKVALFLQLRMLEGAERHRTIYGPHPPSRVWVFIDRIGMDKGGTGAWYRFRHDPAHVGGVGPADRSRAQARARLDQLSMIATGRVEPAEVLGR